MSGEVVDEYRGCGITVESDVDELIACINGIRNAYTPVRDRQPLCFDRSERRGSARVPLKIPVRVTPVILDAGHVRLTDGKPADISADTTNLSLRGMGFSHAVPFPHRHAAITFRVPAAPDVSVLVELRWTATANEGRLRSGARFLGLTELPRPAT